jgi:nodulation protein E
MLGRVVVTGLGCVSGFGIGVADFWVGLVEGRSAIAPLTGIENDLKIRIGATVRGYKPEDHFSVEDLTLLDRFSQFAVLAAREAMEDAGLKDVESCSRNVAAVVGTGCGGKQTDEEIYSQLYKKFKSRAHPLTIPKGMPSAAASMVSMHLGIKGPVFSIASACASGAHAISQGCLMIQTGMVDVALVGGTDAPFTYGLLKAWEALRVVSSDTCRPFSHDRTGIVLGEGAGMILLESEAHARERRAGIYAEVIGYGLSSDAGHITRPDVDGIVKAIETALGHAGLMTEQVTYVNAHGTGTQANDITETEAMHRVFGSHAGTLAISSTKSAHGHALGASSALEFIATVLTVHHGMVPPTTNFTTAGNGCDLDYVPNNAREMSVEVALSSSFAFGGLNAVLALRSYPSGFIASV